MVETPMTSPFTDILDKTFLYGHGVGAAEDIAPEDKEKAFINTRKYALTEGEQAILQVIAEAIGEITDPNHRHFNATTGDDEPCILVSEIRAKLGIEENKNHE
jgi:hypothetical protein